jgi:nicotinate phosphoribosyltransferase
LGGCAGTSNADAGLRFGIPVYGTAAHSWTQAFDSEREAFARLQEALGERTIYLLDTYDVEAAARNAAGVGKPFLGVRLDSGDLAAQSRMVRKILDEAGYRDARIMASGDLNEHRIGELVEAGAPIDWFGAGTELATSADAPHLASIYKLVQIGDRPTAKFSEQKLSLPGVKQVFRFPDHDVVGLAEESFPRAKPLLEPVVREGRRVGPAPGLAELRERARARLAALPPSFEVRHSEKLRALMEQVRTAHDPDR